MVVVATAFSASAVYAQPAAGRAAKPKLDLGYVTPDCVAAVSLCPQSVLASPDMELLPTEVLSAWGIKEFGIDPLQIEHVLVIVEPPAAGPAAAESPRGGTVMRFSRPLAPGKVLGKAWEATADDTLNGKPYRRAKSRESESIFQPDPQTLIVADDGLLRKMVANHAQPKEGKMSKMLARVTDAPEVMAVVLIEPLRGLIAQSLAPVALPAPLTALKNVPNLVSYVAVKANLTGDMDMTLSIRANDEAAAQQLERVVDGLLTFGKQYALSQVAPQAASSDPVDQATAKYAARAIERIAQMIRPVRNGATLSLSGSGRDKVLIAAVAGLGGALLPAVQASREAGRRVVSMNNLKQIGLAMHAHNQAKGAFPAQANFDAQGKPLLSWRVHILPYLDQQDLYQKFHLDEPWDSENNKKLIPLMPAIYQNPNAQTRAGMANYLGVSGPGLMFEGAKARTLSDIKDGTSQTIMVVEADDQRAVVWTKPDDWTFNSANPLAGLGNAHPAGFSALFCDGSVRLIAKNIDRTVFTALLTIAGGEVITGQ
jgi:hypothetical protein